MAISKAQQNAVAKYNAKTYDRLELKVLKGKKQAITDIAKTKDKSLNGYIKEAVQEKIKADTGNDIEL